MRNPIVVLGIVLILTTQATAAEIDPLVWSKPTQPPEFRERLSADDFQKRSRAVLDELGDLKKLELSQQPDHGIRIKQVTGGDQAASWNLQPGDILTKIDQFDLWGGGIPNKDSRRRVTFFSVADGKSRTVNAEAGPLGVFIGWHWRPELAFLHSKKNRQAKWDELVVVGSHSFEFDPDLAETAWFKAFKAGYPRDELANICGAMIALKQGRPEEAADFAYLAREAEPKQAKFVSPIALLRVMLANYKLDDAFELCQRFPQQLVDEPRLFRALADMHRGRSQADRLVEPPSRLAEKRYRDELLSRCFGRTRDTVDLLPKLRERNGVTMQVRGDYFIPLELVPPETARDLELNLTYQALSAATGEYEANMQVGLAVQDFEDGLNRARINSPALVALRVSTDAELRLHHGYSTQPTPLENSDSKATTPKSHHVRVVRIGGQAEIFFDGRRVLYQPVDPTATHVVGVVRIVGMHVKLESLEFHELLERR